MTVERTRRAARLVTAGALVLALGPFVASPGGAAPAPAPQTDGVSTPESPPPFVPDPPASLEISTDDAAPVLGRDDYVHGTMSLAGQEHGVRIKGRGNSTWAWPKKPYKIKLDEDASLLGMPATEEWVLLANYSDRSALRTHFAFAFASRTRLAWTPRSRPVAVTLNGDPLGLYTLTEQVEQGPTRVALPEGGYLLEVDEKFRRTGDPGFRSRRRTPIAYKDPDELEQSEIRTIKRAVNQFEDVLYGDDFDDPERGYAAFVDLDSFVDWYLVQEFFRNQDSNFYSSVHFTWHPDGKFAMGPVWDFDLSAGSGWTTKHRPWAWHLRSGTHWLARMSQDPAFVQRVHDRWRELRPVADELVAQIPAAAEALRPTALADWDRWHTAGFAKEFAVHADTFDDEVAHLQDWLWNRAWWLSMDQVLLDSDKTLRAKEGGPVREIPIRRWGQATWGMTVRYAWEPGEGASLEDLEETSGEVSFLPGDRQKTVALRLRDDAVAEPDESFTLVLTEVTGGGISTPDRRTVIVRDNDQQPDLAVRVGRRGAFVGNDTYARRPGVQRVEGRVARGARRVLTVRLQHDGFRQTRFTVRGSRAGRHARVRYRHGGRDVTAALLSERGWRPRMQPGSSKVLRVVVRAKPRAERGAQVRVKIRSEWTGDQVLSDAVSARLEVVR